MTGSLQVWVSEDAALKMADARKEEFLKRLKTFNLAFQAVNVKLVKPQKEGRKFRVVGAAQGHAGAERQSIKQNIA